MTEDKHKGKVRCAIYTRKSSEEGLEQEFNSLHAQREACEAYIASQKHEGWTIIKTGYDDGGFSGGSMNRPSVAQLMADIKAGLVDVVVVYKIDRLTRSLFDFAKIVEVLDEAKTSFVSITQSFNTTTSMGRLTLNVLLSFAQFEREVTSERIRDKIAASKKKGMWMGGQIPLGFDLEDRKLIVNAEEENTVHKIFELYAKYGTVQAVRKEINRLGHRTKRRQKQKPCGSLTMSGNKLFGAGHIYWILNNPIYIGQIRHKGNVWPGEHKAIIDMPLWDNVQDTLKTNRVDRTSPGNFSGNNLLTGLIFDTEGNRLTPSFAIKGGRRYRYYISGASTKTEETIRLPAPELERAVITSIAKQFAEPLELIEMLGFEPESPGVMEKLLERIKQFRNELSQINNDQHESVRGLIQRVEVSAGQINIAVSADGLRNILLDKTIKTDPEATATIKITVSFEKARIGKSRKLILVPDGIPEPVYDQTMILAIARARQWFDLLASDSSSTISDLARSANKPRSWVSAQLSLAFLAPDIITAILQGRQPQGISLRPLLKIAAVYQDWSEQKMAFERG